MSIRKESVSTQLLETLPETLAWSDRPRENDLAPLPACPAVYLLLTSSGAPVHLATTQHLRRLAISRLADPARGQHGKADLAEIVRTIRWREVYSAFEGRWWYYRLARELHPKQYRRLISFGPVWFLHFDNQQPLPELRITEFVWQAAGQYVGPWLTHDTCQKALEGLQDLFDLCRYPEQVRRAPRGQRCAYADMDRCDAPCDGSVALERYITRSRAAGEFARGTTGPWFHEARERMRQAALQERFEQAGIIKKQLHWAGKWEESRGRFIRPAEELNYLLAVPVTRRRSWRLFLFWRGALISGPVVSGRILPAEASGWLREQLEHLPEPADARIRAEQTWLVAHFLHSKEGDASLVEHLPVAEVPAGLEDTLSCGVAKRRSKPES